MQHLVVIGEMVSLGSYKDHIVSLATEYGVEIQIQHFEAGAIREALGFMHKHGVEVIGVLAGISLSQGQSSRQRNSMDIAVLLYKRMRRILPKFPVVLLTNIDPRELWGLLGDRKCSVFLRSDWPPRYLASRAVQFFGFASAGVAPAAIFAACD